MLVVKQRRGTEESFLADFAFVSPRRQIGMCLARGSAFDTRQTDAAIHEKSRATGLLVCWSAGQMKMEQGALITESSDSGQATGPLVG